MCSSQRANVHYLEAEFEPNEEYALLVPGELNWKQCEGLRASGLLIKFTNEKQWEKPHVRVLLVALSEDTS